MKDWFGADLALVCLACLFSPPLLSPSFGGAPRLGLHTACFPRSAKLLALRSPCSPHQYCSHLNTQEAGTKDPTHLGMWTPSPTLLSDRIWSYTHLRQQGPFHQLFSLKLLSYQVPIPLTQKIPESKMLPEHSSLCSVCVWV